MNLSIFLINLSMLLNNSFDEKIIQNKNGFWKWTHIKFLIYYLNDIIKK